MSELRRVLQVGVLLVAVSASPACFADFLNPCDRGSTAANSATRAKNENLLDGIWELYRINGSPIPARGYEVNSTKGDFLVAGSFDFKTRKIENSCSDPGKSSGTGVARYVIGNGAGAIKQSKVAAGGFDNNPKTKIVILNAFKYVYPGTVSKDASGTYITVVGLHPEEFTKLTLTFRR